MQKGKPGIGNDQSHNQVQKQIDCLEFVQDIGAASLGVLHSWSPHYIKDKQMLEKVQHRFTRMAPGLKHLPYDERLKQLGLWSLEERRNTGWPKKVSHHQFFQKSY